MKKSTIKIMGIALVIGSLLGGIVGCATMTEADFFGTFLKAAAVAGKGDATIEERQVGIMVGEMFQEQGRRKHELDVAEKQRSQINVNVNR